MKNKINFIPIIITSILFLLMVFGLFLLKNKKDPICNNISIKVFEKNNEPVLCVFPDYSKLQMILENNGEEKIDKVDIILKGQTEKKDTSNINLMPNQVFTKVLDNNEKIEEIAIFPIKTAEKDIKCQPVVYKNIKFC